MNKVLKWTLIILGSFFLIILLAAFIIPVAFKDDIRKAVDAELAKSVNADIVLDTDDFSLTLFRHFPNVTVQMDNLGVINREPFEGEVLFATERLEVVVNLSEILFGDQLRINAINLVRPIINIKVLEDGRANYDIAIPSADTVAEESGGEFSFGINRWEVIDADVVYDDRSIPFTLTLKGLNHEGSGDFSNVQFDLTTHSTVDTLTVAYDGTEYITNKKAQIDAILGISEEYSLYTFRQNVVKINDFLTTFDGWFRMNEDNYEMDISFKTPENTFKSLLSLVPGMYTSSFDGIEADGDVAFNGMVKGTYSENQMPAFNLALQVSDGKFKYPDLPQPVENINVDLVVDNKDGVVENTSIDLKKFQMNFGSNPVQARASIANLRDYRMDANVVAQVNLEELMRVFPMEGLELKGNYSLDLKAKGVYDSVRNIMPSVDARMVLANGYVKSDSLPAPLQDVGFKATVSNQSGKMQDTRINVEDFSMLLEGERLSANLSLEDLVDYKWDLEVNGAVNLAKMMKIFPQEGMSLSGKVIADITTKGRYSDLKAERYDRMPTSGTASLEGFTYASKDVPYQVTVSRAAMNFDPRQINLRELTGTIGNSDFSVNGSVLNYIGYVLGKGETIRGVVNFSSKLLDLNEFMTDGGETSADTSSYGVLPVPKDIDFVLHSSVGRARFMDFNITDATGDIVVKDGVANLKGLKFKMLGGAFAMNGSYDPRVATHPKYDVDVKVESLSIQQAAQSLTLVRTYAPIAGLVQGNFSTDFKLSGELTPTMSPNLGTVNADGLIRIAQAALTQSKLIAGVTSLTKLDNTDKVTLRDVLMSATITNGRLSVKPFDIKVGDYKTSVSGSTGLDGSIDYTLKMNVPAGKMGSQLQQFINKNTGSNNPTDVIPVTIALGNTYDNPQFRLIADEQKEQVKEAVASAAKEQASKAIGEAVKGTEAEDLVKGILGNKKDTTATGAQDTAATKTQPTDVKEQIKDEARKKIQDLLKRK
ncbi:MAG TPA: AsmA-like C-terminal region-containing protein [Cyclobacteriaceae bacterium]